MSRITPADYEIFVQKVVAELFGVEIDHQKMFVGRVSGREIKVDLSCVLSVGGGARLLILLECKYYNSPITVDAVEEFHSKLDDIGAQKGVMITTIGYQDGAIKTAKGRGIALALLTTEFQKGELRYIVNGPLRESPLNAANESLIQGNILGFLDLYDGGLRFENFGQLYGIWCMEFMRQRV